MYISAYIPLSGPKGYMMYENGIRALINYASKEFRTFDHQIVFNILMQGRKMFHYGCLC